MKKSLRRIYLMIVILVFIGCNGNKIPKYVNMKINENYIEEDEVKDTIEILKKIPVDKYKFRDDPDYMMIAYKKNDSYDIYSIYLKDKRIYPGDGFHALFDNLSRRASICYIIPEEELYWFKDLEKYLK